MYVPLVVTVIACVTADVDQTLPEACEDVKSTEPPAQNVVGPFAETTGAVGAGLTVTSIGADVAEQPLPSVYVTLYVPLVVTVIACDTADVDQTLPDACEDVKSTEPPAQNVVGPLGVIVGELGGVGSKTV